MSVLQKKTCLYKYITTKNLKIGDTPSAALYYTPKEAQNSNYFESFSRETMNTDHGWWMLGRRLGRILLHFNLDGFGFKIYIIVVLFLRFCFQSPKIDKSFISFARKI